jgi:serine/threonine protein phosphatase PrpC
MMARKNARDGDPIADHYGLAAWHNRVLATVADGCSWGVRAQQAAARAVDTNLSDFTESKVYLSDLREVAMELLKSVAHVHDSIAQGKKVVWDAGTTTLLSGVLVEIEPTPQLNNANWAFVCVNVGDCKAFLWSKSTHQVTDITAGNRLAISDPKDPGGRLGPYIYQGAPDLRNMNFFYTPCALDDLLILCSDGLHDNLDPELNGISPKELAGLVANYQNVR